MKQPIVFLHGWGQAAQTWYAQMEYFSSRREAHALNLPGHGGVEDVALDNWDAALLEGMPEIPVILVGWSLGGMLALRLARRHAERFAGIVLVSTTPSFRMRPGWENGCADDVFERFQESLEADEGRLLDRFFALMLQGEELDRRRYLDIVRQAVDRRNPATPVGLRAGLSLLDELDLRDLLGDVQVPVLVVHGAFDAVTPVEAGKYLAEHIPEARLQIMQTGHGPHLTQPEAFNDLLEEWCLNNISI